MRFIVTVMALAAIVLPRPVSAQTPRPANVTITVVDPSGAVVAGATVAVTTLETATETATVPQTKTNDRGVVVLQAVAPGRYDLTATFPGFDMGALRNVTVRAGDSRHVIMLPLSRLQETVEASDRQADAGSRRPTEFGLTLSREQIEALSDDPAELARQVAELAGSDAVIRVDSFEGQQLPPKAQIKSIHVTRDQFAAEAANPGSTFVDVVTQPGIGAIRGTATLSYREEALGGRSRFTEKRQDERVDNYNVSVSGAIVPERTSFLLSVGGQRQYVTPILNVTMPDGTRAETLSLRQGFTSLGINASVDHSITRDHVLKAGYYRNRGTNRNWGVGNYDLPERAFERAQRQDSIRVQEAGPIGRRAFVNTRFNIGRGAFLIEPFSDAQTIVVSDAFTKGGAQQHWDVTAWEGTLASDLDYVRGIHSWRVGFVSVFVGFESVNTANLGGTFTFSSLPAYLDGQPSVYTQSIGQPHINYLNVQGGVYFQDDIRVRRGFTLSPGVRYTLQKRISDRTAFEPRFGFTWAPSSRGTTTLRGSIGLFHGFMNPEIIEQTLRLDGINQREIVITDPDTLRAIYAGTLDPTGGTIRPSSKYIYADGFRLQRNLRYSAGIEQVLSTRLRASVLYNYVHLQQQPRARNLNAPVNGVRPDPAFANVLEAVTDAEIRRHEVFVNATMALAPPSPALQQARFNWRRMSFNAGYTFVHARNNSAGAWAVPPTGDLNKEWGPGPADAPYRVQILVTSTQLRNLTVTGTYVANAGLPYNWTTGFDDNRDGFVNDRPAGVGLRSLRGMGHQTLNLRVAYSIVPGGPPAPGTETRYRLQFYVNAQNITNHQNLSGYSGVETSRNFRHPTNVANPRKVDFGTTIGF